MIRRRRIFPWPVVAALAALFLTFIVSSAAAKQTASERTADRSAVYNTGGFTFGNTQQLLQSGPLPLTGFSLEPEIKTDLHQNVYVTAMEGVPGGVDLWKSTNLGGSFTYLGQPDGAQCPVPPNCVNGVGLGGGDDSIDVSSGGYLYVSSLWLGSTTLSTSMDGGTGGVLPGQAWVVNPLAGNPPALDRQWIAAYGPETLYQSYTEIATGTVFVVKSVDAGATFGAPVPVYPVVGTTIESFRMGNLVVDQYNGNIYLAFVADATLGHTRAEVWLGKSTNGGASWTLSKAYQGPAGSNAAHSFPITAVDRGGNVHIGFGRCDVNAATQARTNCQIWLVSSADQGASWLDAVRVSNGPDTQSAVFPWIVAGSPGVVDVAWYGSAAVNPDLNAGQSWHVMFAQTPNALSATPTFNQVQHPQVMHDSSICFRGLDCDLPTNPGNRDLAEYFSMTVDPDGSANIAFSDTVTNCLEADGCIVKTWYTKQSSGPSAYAPPPPPAPSTFGPNLILPGSLLAGTAEPSVWVDSHDCIYATGPGTDVDNGQPLVWRSTNGGVSFDNPVNPVATEPTLTGGDEDVVTIPQASGARPDDIYFADLGLSTVHIRKSTDNAATWFKPGGNAGGDTAVSSDRQWLATDRVGTDQIVYEWDHELASEIMRFSSLVNDSATGWVTTSGMTDPEIVPTVPNTNPGPIFTNKTTHRIFGLFNGSVPTTNAGDPPFGKLLNVWEADGTPPANATSAVGSVTNHPVFKGVFDSASNPPPAVGPPTGPTYGTNNANIFPAGDIDSAGNIYVAWSMNSSRTNEFSIWLAASHDNGQTYYGPWRVSQGPGTAVFPWVAAGDNGRVDVIWFQTSAVGDPNELTGNPPWNVYFGQSLNANSREPVFRISQVSDHVIHNGRISTGGTIGSSDRSLLDFIEVATDRAGKAHIVWADNGGQAVHVRYAKQATGPVVDTTPTNPGCLQPTAVSVASFRASVGRDGARITWSTSSEIRAAGFNIWRSVGKLPYRKLNAKLIPSKGTFGVGGHRYEYLDRGALARGAYSYKLELVSLDGKRQWAGSVRASVRAR